MSDKVALAGVGEPATRLQTPGYVSDEGDETEDDFPRVEPLTAGVGGQDLSRSENEAVVTDATRTEAKCLDCGLDYAAFPMDLLLPRWQWLLIHPDEGGLLCAQCIMTRASKLPGAVAVHAVIGMAPETRTD